MQQKGVITVALYLVGDANTLEAFWQRHGRNILKNVVSPYNLILIRYLNTYEYLYLIYDVIFNTQSLFHVSE